MNRPIRTILGRLLVPLLSVAIAACGSGKGPSNTPASKGRIAIVVSTLNNPWFVILAHSAQDEVGRLGYTGVIFDSQNDAAHEATQFDDIIASNYRAILLNATDSKGSVANVRRAHTAGIPVFAMDRELESADAVASQIVSDNFGGAQKLGENFLQQVGDSGQYIELLGILTDNNTWSRSKGFHSVVDSHAGLKMVAQQSADFDRNRGMEVAESVLQAHPTIDAIFCGNDAMALGAYQALLASGRANKVKVFGFDGSADGIRAVDEGKMAATVMQHPEIMAKTAAEFADRYLSGDHAIPARVPVPVEVVTRDNAKQFQH